MHLAHPIKGLLAFSLATSAVLLSPNGVQYLTEHQLANIHSLQVSAAVSSRMFGYNSPFNHTLPSTAVYTRDDQIGTIRPAAEAYSIPIYRINGGVPLVHIFNPYGRTADWPVPASASPATGSDHGLVVNDEVNHVSYEMLGTQWTSSNSISTLNMKDFPVMGASATGISNPTNETITGGGFSLTAGAVLQEDFYNPSTQRLDPNMDIPHALVVTIPSQLVQRNVMVAPAIRAEFHTNATGNIPYGALFALPRNLNVDALPVSPLTKAMAKAARDYGVYVDDMNGTQPYNGKGVATVRMEPGLTQILYGVPNDQMMNTVQAEMYNIIQTYGLYRVTGVDFSYVNGATTQQTPPPPTPAPTPAPTPQPQPSSQPGSLQTLDLAPDQDTTVRKTDPDTADGADAVLKTGGYTGDIAYLRFNLARAAGRRVVSARLRLNIVNPSNGNQYIHEVSNQWNESTLTYHTQPPLGSQIFAFNTQGGTGWVGMDLTSYFSNKVGQEASLAITSDSTDGFWVNSKESTAMPTLHLELE